MQQERSYRHGDTGRINLPTRFDAVTSGNFRVPFVRLLGDAEARRVVVNFGALDYIDSMGIGTLISWQKSCREKGKPLVLEGCDTKVRKTLKLVGVEALFEFASSGR